MAPHGGRPAGRRAQRPVVHLPPRPPDPGEAGRVRRRDGPAAPGPDLGLPGARQPGRTGCRRGARGDQRPGRRQAAAGRLHRAQGRRLDGLRLVDLLRRPRGGQNRPPAARPGRDRLGRARVGLGVAGEQARPVQPRVRRPRGQARGATAKALVWWDVGEQQVDRPRRPRLRPHRPPGYRPAPGRPGVAAISGTTRSSCKPTAGRGCSRPAGLVDGPLPAHYEPQESPVANPLYGQQRNPVRQIFEHRENRLQPSGDEPGASRLPVRGHHLPPNRAPHRRRDVALPAVPGGAAAGAVLRGVSRARRRTRARPRRLGHDRLLPRRDRGAGAGDPTGSSP